MLDIRTPIGLMFLVLGCLIGAYGLVTPAEMYRMSLGINVNLLWGGCMAVFGALMLGWQWLSPQKSPQVPEAELSATVPAETDGVSAL